MWKRVIAFYDWLGRIEFAHNLVEWLLGKTVWTKISLGFLALLLAITGWLTSLGLALWQRIAITLLFAVLALALANLALHLWEQIKRKRKPSGEHYDAPHLMSLRELFAHIHPQPLDDQSEREAIGREIIDQIASARLGSYGRRIEGSKRLAIEPIPHNVWARAKFTYWFLDSRMDRTSLHVECGRDQPGLAPLHYADVRVIREQALEIWAYIPLRDAARIAYESSRESLYAKAAERFGEEFRTGPDGTLHFYASAMYLYHTVYGERLPATVREPIPMNLRPSTRISKDCSQLLPHGSKQPVYVNLKISRADLDDFIEWAKTTRLEVESG